jgi:hypothetical protein
MKQRRHPVFQPQDTSIKLIPLTQGLNAIVDASDYYELSQWSWYATLNVCTRTYYAVRWDNGRGVYMQNQIMGGKGNDHRNKNTLDNRRSNLRKCTSSQNGANRGKNRNNSTGYKGVFKATEGSTFMARITVNRKPIYLGSFRDKESAARAYDTAAVANFGEFAHLNFPACK